MRPQRREGASVLTNAGRAVEDPRNVAADESKPSDDDDDDALQRAEFERETEAFERSRTIKPSRRVYPPDAELGMSQIIFNDYPMIWLGDEHTVFVYFLDGERRVDRVLDVTWISLDPTVLPIIEAPRPISSSSARLLGRSRGRRRSSPLRRWVTAKNWRSRWSTARRSRFSGSD